MPKEYLWESGRSRRRNEHAEREPEPVRPPEAAEVPEPSRVLRPRPRFPAGWLGRALALLSVVLFGVTLVMLGGPSPGSEPRYKVVASVAELRELEVMLFPDERVALVWHSGEIFALSTRSPHLRHEIQFCPTSRWFEDPIHGEKFDIRGYYRAGPAPRGMDRHPFAIEGGTVKVATDEVIEGPPRGSYGGGNPQPEGPFCLFDDAATGHG